MLIQENKNLFRAFSPRELVNFSPRLGIQISDFAAAFCSCSTDTESSSSILEEAYIYTWIWVVLSTLLVGVNPVSFSHFPLFPPSLSLFLTPEQICQSFSRVDKFNPGKHHEFYVR